MSEPEVYAILALVLMELQKINEKLTPTDLPVMTIESKE